MTFTCTIHSSFIAGAGEVQPDGHLCEIGPVNSNAANHLIGDQAPQRQSTYVVQLGGPKSGRRSKSHPTQRHLIVPVTQCIH